MTEIQIYVGFDERQVVGYHVFCNSVLRRTKAKVTFHPVRGEEVIGSTKFNPERFSIPQRMGYRGFAVWAECDMLCLADIEELMAYADRRLAVAVVKHDYRTKHATKFLGQPNPDYERKNWSSLMLINCANYAWESLQYSAWHSSRTGQDWTLGDLHRFRHIDEDRVGELPREWNHIVSELEPNPNAKIAHFSIGLPCWPEYANCEYADAWREELDAMLYYQKTPCAQAA